MRGGGGGGGGGGAGEEEEWEGKEGGGDEGDLIGDELHSHGEADDELVEGGGPGVEPHARRLVLQGQGQALDGGVEGEGHHHKHRPGGRKWRGAMETVLGFSGAKQSA